MKFYRDIYRAIFFSFFSYENETIHVEIIVSIRIHYAVDTFSSPSYSSFSVSCIANCLNAVDSAVVVAMFTPIIIFDTLYFC